MLYTEALKLPEYTQTMDYPQRTGFIGGYTVLPMLILRKRTGSAWHKFAAVICPHNPEPILVNLEKIRNGKVTGCRECCIERKHEYKEAWLVEWWVEGKSFARIVDTDEEAMAIVDRQDDATLCRYKSIFT
jgi:hypothetical protein